MSKYRNRREAAAYIRDKGLPCTPGSLAKLASIGGGPLYQIFNKTAVYTDENLDDWCMSRLGVPRRSTSEAA